MNDIGYILTDYFQSLEYLGLTYLYVDGNNASSRLDEIHFPRLKQANNKFNTYTFDGAFSLDNHLRNHFDNLLDELCSNKIIHICDGYVYKIQAFRSEIQKDSWMDDQMIAIQESLKICITFLGKEKENNG